MSKNKLIEESNRMMTICNSCRYCEGFCAVFPAIELRRVFTEGDLKYFANLCHNCRDCYYACQFAPPHEYDLNFPKMMAEMRMQNYADFSWPSLFKGAFRRNGLVVSLITLICVAIFLLLAYFQQGPAVLFGTHTGASSFYKVISYMSMIVPFSVLALLIILSHWKSIANLLRETEGSAADLFNPRANWRAIKDVLQLKYLSGGGHGCNYPNDEFSMVRRYFHHFTFYGFGLCFASTVVALFYDHILHLEPPYPLLSIPVILGTVGGVGILIGTIGLFYLKLKMDKEPNTPQTSGMDFSFIILLFLTSLSGLLLMLFRDTSYMGVLLAVHLGLVAGFFIMMPYGKFLHVAFRYTALVRNAIEQERDEMVSK